MHIQNKTYAAPNCSFAEKPINYATDASERLNYVRRILCFPETDNHISEV